VLVVGEARDERMQSQNKKLALQRLINSPKFRAWAKLRAAVIEQGYRDIEAKVDDLMREENIRIEYYTPKDA
jgi:hypothetical protein